MSAIIERVKNEIVDVINDFYCQKYDEVFGGSITTGDAIFINAMIATLNHAR
jgi:hypothetical protein